MRHYRTFNEITEEYYLNNPDEIGDFIKLNFEEYAKDNDTSTLFSALCMIARVKGVSPIPDETDNPYLEDINSIMQSFGYRLAPEKAISEEIN